MLKLHDYLSLATKSGVSHCVELNEGLELDINKARLKYNLIWSYLMFLISKHERLQR